jgi:glycogen synthase
MHFLHVVHRYHPYVGGSESYVQDLSERLVRDGHRVTVATTDAWDLEHLWSPARHLPAGEAWHHGVRILRFPVRHLPQRPPLHRYLRRALRGLSRVPGTTPVLSRLASLSPYLPALDRYLARTEDQFDLVLSTNIVLDSLVLSAHRFARRRGIPHLCVPFVHLGEAGTPDAVLAHAQRHQVAVLRQADRVIAQTALEAEFLAAHGVSPAALRTVGAWVRPEHLQGGDAGRFRARHRVRGAIVLSIGVAAYVKGTVHLVEAMRRLWQDGSDAELVLIAASIQPEFATHLAGLPGDVRRRVHLLEAATHETKLDALAAAAVLALPSRSDSFGIVFLEAWMHRVPVIGARAGGIPAVIDEGRDGLLVPFGDTGALAGALARLLSDRSLAGTLAEAGRAKVLDRFTFEHRYAAFRQVYDEVLPRGS